MLFFFYQNDSQSVHIHRSKQLTITADGQTGPELVVSVCILLFSYFTSVSHLFLSYDSGDNSNGENLPLSHC